MQNKYKRVLYESMLHHWVPSEGLATGLLFYILSIWVYIKGNTSKQAIDTQSCIDFIPDTQQQSFSG